MRISKAFSFEAAHRLQNHKGKCRNLHGHSYKVVVSIVGYELHEYGSSKGMVLDFDELKRWSETSIDVFDHKTILELSDPLLPVLLANGVETVEMFEPPTAENLAIFFRESVNNFLYEQKLFESGGFSSKVRVYETTNSFAEA